MRRAFPRGRGGSAAAVVLTVLLLAGFAAVVALAGSRLWHYFRNPSELRLLVQGWGGWAPVGIVLLQTLQIAVAPLPGNVVSFVCGYALGVWPTIGWLMAGVLVGAAVDFLIARLLGRRLIGQLVPADKLARLDRAVLSRGALYIFLLLLVPNPLGDWVYYLAGLTVLPLPVFLAMVFVARLPSNLLECLLGSSATRFGWFEWLGLGLMLVALGLLYYLNQSWIERVLERLSSRSTRR